MTSGTIKISETEIQEWVKCKYNLLYFLWPSMFGDEGDKDKQFVYFDDPQLHEVVAFEPWPHLVEFARAMARDQLIILIKTRQGGASWGEAAVVLWDAMFWASTVDLLMSQGEDDAKVLLTKVKSIWSHLPEHLRAGLTVDNTEELKFRATGGSIMARPSTARAGHGITATRIIGDEFEFHQYAAEFIVAAKPAIDHGGKLILSSTVDKLQMDTTFKAMVKAAQHTEDGHVLWDIPSEGHQAPNGWRLFFWPYNVRPGRDEVWYERRKAEVRNDEVLAKSGLTPDMNMESNYPRTLMEALSPAQALAAFNPLVLKSMQDDCRLPNKVDGQVNVWQEYIVGKTYAMFSDTSHGVGGDDSVTTVMECRSGMVVADVQSNRLGPAEFASESYRLHKMYGEPLWGIEDNEWGALVIYLVMALGAKNLFCREWQKAGRRSDKPQSELTPGWHTGPTMGNDRVLLYGELILAVNSYGVIIPSKAGMAQFFDCIRNPDKYGRIEAVSGGHDDYPLAVGGCVQMRKYVTFSSEDAKINDTMGWRGRGTGRRRLTNSYA